MPALEIKLPSGSTEIIQLSKETPVSIGSHTSNDVHIDDESIQPLHCRISWQKNKYRINSAGGSKVVLNGENVAKASVRAGDVIQLGNVQINVVEEFRPLHDDNANAELSEFELKPLDSDEDRPILAPEEPASPPPPPPEKPKSKPAPPKEKPQAIKSSSSSKERPKKASASRKPLPTESVAELSLSDVLEYEEESSASLPAGAPKSEKTSKKKSSRSEAKEKDEEKPERKKKEKEKEIKPRFSGRAVRPGERNILQSPLVLTLGGGVLLLLLLAFTFRFMNDRQEIQGRYDEAQNAKEQGKYTQAIKAFEKFLVDYPNDELSNTAQVQLGLTRIEQHVGGSSPSWDQGLEKVHEFREKSKDLPEFSDEKIVNELEDYLKSIAMGSARTAKSALDPELLVTSEEAGKLLQRTSVDKKGTDEYLLRVRQAVDEAKAAILKDNTFNEAVAKIQKSLEESDTIAALTERRALLARYPDFESHREIRKLMDQALTQERESVKRETQSVAAITTERPSDVASELTLVRSTRAKSGNQSEGQGVITLAENACYAIDTINGEPIWRRVIGFDTPFFPIERAVPDPALLMFDARYNELMLVSKENGQLIWRNSAPGRASGPPVVNEGQIFLPTETGQLCQYDLETGEFTSQLTFAQPISSAPAISESGEFLFVAGHRGVMYILSRRPLECLQVFDSGHAPGVIEAPLMAMGPYLLAIENSSADNCRLRLYDVTAAADGIKEVASYQDNNERLGHVKDAPVLRGNRLFVPSSGERVTAFTVTEEDGQKPLSYVGSAKNESPGGGPVYLAAGADDLMWMAARDLRKFQLNIDSLEEEVKQRMRVGVCAQPLQVSGNSIFVGGRFPSSRTIFFRAVDPQSMTGKWLTAVGSSVMATAAPEADSIVCVTAAGNLYAVTPDVIEQGGFHTRPLAQLRVQDDLDAIYQASRLPDGRLAVYTSGKKSHLWVITLSGAIDFDVALDQPLQTAPINIGRSVLLPKPGQLQLIGRSANNNKVQNFKAPVSGEAADAWKSLAPLEENQALVLTASGRLSRLQLRDQDDISYFEEVTSIELEHPVEVGLRVTDDRLVLANDEPVLNLMNARSLEVTATAKLPSPAPQLPWVVNGRIYAQSGRDRLICFGGEVQLEPLWELSLSGASVAGEPLQMENAMLIALQNGEIISVEADSGAELNRWNIQQAISDGPYLLGGQTVVISPDGSFVKVNTESKEVAQ